jgi:hypothetical protein
MKFPKTWKEEAIEARLAFLWRKHKTFAFATIVWGFMVVSTSTFSQPAPRVKLLDDFETEASFTRWQGPAKMSTAHASHGRNCLQVQFNSHSAILTTSPQDGNWTGYDRLLFDAYNTEATPIILSFRLYDAVGGDAANTTKFDFYQANQKLFLGSGWTHVEVVLANLNASSELRPMALDRIRRLTLAADGSRQPLTLWFDNFRVVAGSEGTSTASLPAPQDTVTRLEGRWVTILQVGPQDKIPESLTVKTLRHEAQQEHQALRAAIRSSELMGLDTIYSEAELATADLGLFFRPLLPWFNNDREKEKLFGNVTEACREERARLEQLLSGRVRLPERDDTQIPGPLAPPFPRLHGLPIRDGFFQDAEGRPLFVTSLHGPSQGLQRFFATPLQHIESYSVGGGSRWTVDRSPVYEAFQKYPETHRVGWDGWCGHLVRDLDSMGGKKENVVICLESPHIREAVERYIEREAPQWLKNPDLLYNIMAYELQYICYCERSQQMFRTWLERKHGNPEQLNQAWGTHYTSFEEVVAPPVKGARPLPGTNRAQWYDWAVFNQDRFSDYLVWVKGVIRRFDPVTPLAAGGSYSMLYGGNGASGIDEEQIINRVDDVIIHEGSGSTMGMDLQMALAEKPKPLCDPEMNLGEVRYLLPHMLHGKSVIQLWHWPDQPPSEYPRLINDSPAHGWRFPLSDVAALLRTVLDARRFSKEIAAFSAAPAQVAILYSRTSMIQVPPEMLTWRSTPYLRELEKSYEASRFLDTRITFVSESQILAGNLSKFKVLIVPAAAHTRRPVAEAIYRYVEQGGTLVMLPSSFLSDEYNRPADYLRRIEVQVQRVEQPIADRTGEMEQAYDQSFHERVVYHSQQVVDLKTQETGLFTGNAPNLQSEGTRQLITVSGTHEKLAFFPDGQPALVGLSRGKGVIYYSATSLPKASLRSLLDRVFEASGVDRPVRARGENGRPLEEVEARYVSNDSGKLLYLVNFSETTINAKIETRGQATPRLFEFRKQEKLTTGRVSVPAGETLIFRLD